MSHDLIGKAQKLSDLGRKFGPLLYEAEARHLVAREWAETAEDILWRRTKHRLHMTEAEHAAFSDWFDASNLAKSA
jgi:glycerol-3-phosphate dehydrogenase